MRKSKFGNSAEPEENESNSKQFNYYGLTKEQWYALTTEQREIHYNRQNVCDHPYVYLGVRGDKTDERLREAYSYDLYTHTQHSIPHTAEATCECESCINDIGIERGSPFEYKKRRRANGFKD